MATRTTFSLPEEALATIHKLCKKSGLAGHARNQSEIVRAGIVALERASKKDFVMLLNQVEKRRPGRKVRDS